MGMQETPEPDKSDQVVSTKKTEDNLYAKLLAQMNSNNALTAGSSPQASMPLAYYGSPVYRTYHYGLASRIYPGQILPWEDPTGLNLPPPRPRLEDRIAELEKAEARNVPSPVPDSVDPIVAWRGWSVRDGRLQALGMSGVWEPKKAVAATCIPDSASTSFAMQYYGIGSLPHDRRNHAGPCPGRNCSCGYWAFRSLDLLTKALDGYRDTVKALGQVYLWGRVIECENGFRAEYAYPKELWLLGDGMESLGHTYGVPIRTLGGHV